MGRLPDLAAFALLAYAITWLLLGPWFYFFNHVWHHTIPWWMWLLIPLIFFGGWGPSIAALVLTRVRQGPGAVRALLRTLTIWKVHPGWYLFVLLTPFALTVVSAHLSELGPTLHHAFNAAAVLSAAPLALAVALPFGPLGEELGWRGYALPRLLDRYGPWRASLTLGVLWTFWHLPMILLMPGAAQPSFMPLTTGTLLVYLAQITAETGIMTFVYWHTRGSVLVAILSHLAFNTPEALFFAGLPPVAADTQRHIYLINVALLCVVAVACLVLLRRRGRRLGRVDTPVPVPLAFRP